MRNIATDEEASMSGSDDRDTRLTRRQRLIESLNAKEAELSESQGGRSSRPSEGETESPLVRACGA